MEVSLYIPCFNAAETLPFCLEAALRQSLQPKEILVVDDGSTDETFKVASLYPVRIIRHPRNKGLSAARNTALKELNAEYVASADADCILHPLWLEKLTQRLKDPVVAGAGGRLKESYAWSVFDIWRGRHMKQDWGEELCAPEFLFGSNTVFRREVLLEAGLYNENLGSNYEDVDICRRLKSNGYTLVYEPHAYADHLRCDDLLSLFNTYWNWHRAYYEDQQYYSDTGRFLYKIQDNFGLANRLLGEDYQGGNHLLLYLDFLLAFHHSFRDLRFFIAEANRLPADTGLSSGWLSFLDLDFFYHFCRKRRDYSTLMPRSCAFLHNFFALQLVTGKALQQRFESDFARMVCRHLLFSVMGIKDAQLARKVMNVALANRRWEDLFQKGHPYLLKEFLQESLKGLEVWLRHLTERFIGIEHKLMLSAQTVEQICLF